MIRFRVPGTTANIGPGFDSFGMALNIYNEITLEEIEGKIEFLQNGQPSPIALEDNLIYTSFMDTLNKYNHKCSGIRLNLTRCDVPMSRGLGSSATCIVAGIFAANVLMGGILTEEDIINEAVKIEGHPDNIVPAVVGGMTISLVNEGTVLYSKVNVPSDLRLFVMIPDYKLSTEDARTVLPKDYSREECVFNVSRAAMLVNSMNNGDYEKLRVSVQDKIHQNYRKNLIRDIDEVFAAAKKYGSLAEVISGSGSTLIAMVKGDDMEFCENMKIFLSKLKDNWQVHLLKPDFEGIKVLE